MSFEEKLKQTARRLKRRERNANLSPSTTLRGRVLSALPKSTGRHLPTTHVLLSVTLIASATIALFIASHTVAGPSLANEHTGQPSSQPTARMKPPIDPLVESVNRAVLQTKSGHLIGWQKHSSKSPKELWEIWWASHDIYRERLGDESLLVTGGFSTHVVTTRTMQTSLQHLGSSVLSEAPIPGFTVIRDQTSGGSCYHNDILTDWLVDSRCDVPTGVPSAYAHLYRSRKTLSFGNIFPVKAETSEKNSSSVSLITNALSETITADRQSLLPISYTHQVVLWPVPNIAAPPTFEHRYLEEKAYEMIENIYTIPDKKAALTYNVFIPGNIRKAVMPPNYVSVDLRTSTQQMLLQARILTLEPENRQIVHIEAQSGSSFAQFMKYARVQMRNLAITGFDNNGRKFIGINPAEAFLTLPCDVILIPLEPSEFSSSSPQCLSVNVAVELNITEGGALPISASNHLLHATVTANLNKPTKKSDISPVVHVSDRLLRFAELADVARAEYYQQIVPVSQGSSTGLSTLVPHAELPPIPKRAYRERAAIWWRFAADEARKVAPHTRLRFYEWKADQISKEQ